MRFSLKSLLLMMTLLPAGIALPAASLWFTVPGQGSVVLAFICWLLGGAAIGAALFLPFNKPWFGALLGIMAAFVFPALMALMALMD